MYNDDYFAAEGQPSPNLLARTALGIRYDLKLLAKSNLKQNWYRQFDLQGTF